MNGTITRAEKTNEEVKIQGQTNLRWKVLIESNGKNFDTTILRRPDSPDPTGKEAETYVDKNQKTRWRVASQGGRGDNERETRAEREDRQHRILHEWAMTKALEWTAIQSQRGKVPDDFDRPQLCALADWFAKYPTTKVGE